MKHEDLTEKIIGAAIEVHKHLGPGIFNPFSFNSYAKHSS